MTVLMVVAKAPVPGLVKTRLCPPLTGAQAAEVAAGALLDTLASVRGLPGVSPVLAYAGRLDDAVRADEIRGTLAGWRLIPQRGDGLGERLAAGYADVAAAFPGRPVLGIGMDTPQVGPAVLADALLRLVETGAVLGPATDGGWWALGLADPRHGAALRTVPMSTASTGRLTRAALRLRGVVPAPLPTMADVDDWATALLVARDVPHGRFAAAVRRAALRRGDRQSTDRPAPRVGARR